MKSESASSVFALEPSRFSPEEDSAVASPTNLKEHAENE
jgi:hypothetical protein